VFIIKTENIKEHDGYKNDVDNYHIPATYCISAKPYVTLTTDGRATLGANGAPNKLFIAFLYSDHDVGFQFFVGCEVYSKRYGVL
jgi:hypothetical protein